MKKTNKKIIGVYTNKDLFDKVKKESEKTNRSVSKMIITILEKYFEKGE